MLIKINKYITTNLQQASIGTLQIKLTCFKKCHVHILINGIYRTTNNILFPKY